jgi:hypothetical protein
MRRDGPLPSMMVASAEISASTLQAEACQRHQPSLAELGAADGQHCGLEIDIA